MNQFAKNLLTEWRKLALPFDDETFVIAVSGGADSVSLLLALRELKNLKKLDLRFVVAHYNHDLRGEESDLDTEFVKNLTTEFDFELALEKEKITGGGNLEQNARNERYKFLFETAENLQAYAILTAHSLNDQAETFLHNLMRGSGLQGLGGMKAVTSRESRVGSREISSSDSRLSTLDSRLFLVRPLLNWATREDTENFCRLNEIEFRYDSMNEDLKFNRVRIRKILIPMLEDFNPKIIEILAQTASSLREENEFLDAATQKFFDEKKLTAEKEELKDKTNDDESLQLRELKDLFPSMRRRILRDWLKKRRGDLRTLDAKHFQAIENLIFSRKSGKTVELPNGEILIKNSGNLTFMKSKG